MRIGGQTNSDNPAAPAWAIAQALACAVGLSPGVVMDGITPRVTVTEVRMAPARQLCALVAVGIAGFAAGLMVSDPRTAAQDAPAPRAVVNEDPPNRSLDANLWMQISAEYRACCYQAYNLARRRLIEKVK